MASARAAGMLPVSPGGAGVGGQDPLVSVFQQSAVLYAPLSSSLV